jgi:hypothetical protein
MRYVIGICILTGLIIWDGAHGDGHYLDQLLRGVNWAVGMVTD